MTITLRPYQEAIVDETRVALRTHPSALVQLPTGGGKTAIAGKMIATASGKGRRTWFVCHRVELVEQTAQTFFDVGIEPGFVVSGERPQPHRLVQICSIDTLKHRLDRVAPPDLIVWDEAHHAAAAGWKAVKATFPQAKHVGLSATPERLDGKGLGTQFATMVRGPSVAWLISQGYLSPYRAFAPPAPDMTGVHSRGGDYARGEAADAMDKPTITGDAIDHYLRLARGKRAVAFCVSVEHSKHVAEQFRAAGVMSWHLDGTTPKGERKEAVRAFRNGQIQVLTNVDLFGEGFDLPALEASILLRPTQSLALFLQQCGRALRTFEGKHEALILDHAGNILRHGLPDDEREWSLAGRDKRKKREDADKAPPVRQCPECFHCHAPRPVCPSCGHVYVVDGRAIEHVDGDLAEINAERLRQIRAERERRRRQWDDREREAADARDIDALIQLGVARGYKRPAEWAAHEWTRQAARRRHAA